MRQAKGKRTPERSRQRKPPPRETALAKRRAAPIAFTLPEDDVDRLLAAWLAQARPNTRRARLADLRVFGVAAYKLKLEEGDLPSLHDRAIAMRFIAGGPLQAMELALAWDAAMAEAGQTPRTRARRISTLRTLVDAAAPFGVMWSLKVKGARVKKRGLRRGPPIEKVRAAVVRLEKEERWVDLALVLLCFDTSLRIEEAVSLRIADVNHEQGTIRIVRKGGDRETKTVSQRVNNMLRLIIGVQREGFVFPGKRGAKHMHQGTARRRTKDLGIGTPHSWRHTVTTAAVLAGVPLHVVQKGMGHENFATTQSYFDAARDDEGALARWVAGEEEPG